MFNNVIEKFAKSSLFYSEKYYFTDEDILVYFEKMVNENKLIHIPRFELVICYGIKDTDEHIYSIDYENKKVYFNKELFFQKYVDEKQKTLDSYNMNLQLIEGINSVISRIELYRKLCNPLSFNLEPIFFSCICKSILNNTDNAVAKNFINFYAKYLTTEIIECAASNYKFNAIEELYFNLKTNELIMKYLEKDDCSLIESFSKYYEDNYLFECRDNEELEENLGSTISKNYIKAIYINIKNQRINYNNLLSCILYGKPIKEDIIKDLKKVNNQEPINSILLYAKNIQLDYQNELIRNLSK